MLKVDHHTSIYSRGKFARICVELDLRRELVPSFTVLGAEFKLEYEGLHMICFGCGCYGHKQDLCPSQIRSESPPEASSDKETTTMAADTVGVEEARTARVDNLGNQIHVDFGGTTEEESTDSVFGPWMIATK